MVVSEKVNQLYKDLCSLKAGQPFMSLDLRVELTRFDVSGYDADYGNLVRERSILDYRGRVVVSVIPASRRKYPERLSIETEVEDISANFPLVVNNPGGWAFGDLHGSEDCVMGFISNARSGKIKGTIKFYVSNTPQTFQS